MDSTHSTTPVTKSAWLFECKGIQRYIFGSGRLRQVIGASDLIAGIARSDGEDVLEPVLAAAGVKEPRMSRRAGASFCAHGNSPQELARLRRLWRIVVGVSYPGLEFSDIEPVKAETDLEAAELAYSRLTAVRENSTAFLPPTGHPFTVTNPRTGLIAIDRPRQDASRYLDAVGAPAHRRGEALSGDASLDRLAAAFLPPSSPVPGEGAEAAPPLRFPRHFDPEDATAGNPSFPFTGNDRRIGVIHADLSGLGQVFQSLMRSAGSSRDIFEVAKAIERAIVNAARAACDGVLLPRAIDPSRDPKRFGCLLGKHGRSAGKNPMRIVPARPVLLGGDDLTIIVRADLAIAFSEWFLQEVESQTACEFRNLEERFPDLPERLSACAGIAIVSAGHPFTAAERLAEGLCDSAKTRAKADPAEVPYPSWLDFAVVTSTIDESLASWRDREQTIAADGTTRQPLSIAAGPRRVQQAGATGGGDSLRSLLDLAKALNAAPGRGKLLEALGLRHESKDAADEAWNRFWEVLSDNPDARKELRHVLATCTPGDTGSGDDPPDIDRCIAVVSDALELLDIGAAP